ncbi:YihY/virulence factor BrkB family protein [Streptomyces sp. NPDC005435]|uniref:YihY/virulence factor BrkB family protein n=1 Tax=Streptomyces sp. NPDC005435 TaxID=3154464 RepID=UPI003455890C
MSVEPQAPDASRSRTTSAPRAATWGAALRRTPVAMWRDDVSDHAAALTYYAILTVLPAMLVTVIATALISPGTAERFITQVTAYAPGESGGELHDTLARMLRTDSAVWPLLVTGTVSALWSATSYLAVFRRALHRMYRMEDRRSPWRRAHRIVLTALALLGLLVAGPLVLLLTGPGAEAVGSFFGLGATAALVWSLLRWPLLLCLAVVLVVVVFRTGPAPARTRRHSLPGGVLAAALWLTASGAFALYASALGTYSRLYGSLAGSVVFLIWLWLSNLALLTGAQFTAELNEAEPGPAG